MAHKETNISILSHGILSNKRIAKLRKISFMAALRSTQFTWLDLQHLFEEGLNIIKFTMSNKYGDNTRRVQSIKHAKEVCCEKYGVKQWPSATAISLRADVVRTGLLKQNKQKIYIVEGSEVMLTSDSDYCAKCDSKIIYIDNPSLSIETRIGQEVSIDFNEIVLKCFEKVDEKSIKCLVIRGGDLRSLSEVCIRHDKLNESSSTIDTKVIDFVFEYNIDIISFNFVRNIDTLRKLKKFFKNRDTMPLIFVCISSQQELNIIDDLLKECDGIELERDLLGFTLDDTLKNKWIHIQKWIIAKCVQVGKPCFLTGGVFNFTLDEGIVREVELADVTNAILDGATGICIKNFLSMVNAVEVCKMLNELCLTLEYLDEAKAGFSRLQNEIKMPVNAAEGCVLACVKIAVQTKARFIIMPTVTGKTARVLFWLKPPCIVVGVSTKKHVLRLLYVYNGVLPLKFEEEQQIECFHTRINKRITFAINYIQKLGYLEAGDYFVILRRGSEFSSFCDLISVHQNGDTEPTTELQHC